MPTPSRRNHALLCILGALLIVLSLCYYFHRYPITLPLKSEPEMTAFFAFPTDSAQTCLIVDTIVIRNSFRSGRLSDADFSLQWENVLAQEVGRYSVMSVADLRVETLRPLNLIILSPSVVQSLTPGQADAVRAFVARGGVAVLDYPSSELLSSLGSDSRSTVTADTTLAIRPMMVNFTGFDRYGPTKLPIYSQRLAFESDSATAIEYYPPENAAFAKMRVGRGALYVTSFNFAKAVTYMQQGRPEENFSVVNRYLEQGNKDKLEANDLVTNSIFLDNPIPYADVLEKTLFNFISQTIPLPRWTTAPAGFDGSFLMTHDDEGMGNAGAWMNRYEKANGYRSTTFVMALYKLTREGVDYTRSLGGEFGLHWNRFDRADKGFFEEIGIGRWRPFTRRRNLQSQCAWLDSLGVNATANRNHYFLWDSAYTSTFRKLTYQGFTFESSYGPDLRNKGYLFGTSFPFRPLDSGGAAFSIWELPVTWTENYVKADSVWIERILTDNQNFYHGVVCPLYHNNTFAWGPDFSIYESWQYSYRAASRANCKMMSVSTLERFLANRAKSPIKWESGSTGAVVQFAPQGETLSWMIAKSAGQIHVTDSAIAIGEINSLGVSYWRITAPPGTYEISFSRPPEGTIR